MAVHAAEKTTVAFSPRYCPVATILAAVHRSMRQALLVYVYSTAAVLCRGEIHLSPGIPSIYQHLFPALLVSIDSTAVAVTDRRASTCLAVRSRKLSSPLTGRSDLALSRPIEVPSPPFSLSTTVCGRYFSPPLFACFTSVRFRGSKRRQRIGGYLHIETTCSKNSSLSELSK